MEIQLAIAINFTSTKDNDKEQKIHPKIHNIEVRTQDDPDEIIENFDLLQNFFLDI